MLGCERSAQRVVYDYDTSAQRSQPKTDTALVHEPSSITARARHPHVPCARSELQDQPISRACSVVYNLNDPQTFQGHSEAALQIGTVLSARTLTAHDAAETKDNLKVLAL